MVSPRSSATPQAPRVPKHTIRHALSNTNSMSPTLPKPNGLPTSRSLIDEDGDLIISDIYGQDNYGDRNGMNSIGIFNDTTNDRLDGFKFDGCSSSAGQKNGEPDERSTMRRNI